MFLFSCTNRKLWKSRFTKKFLKWWINYGAVTFSLWRFCQFFFCFCTIFLTLLHSCCQNLSLYWVPFHVHVPQGKECNFSQFSLSLSCCGRLNESIYTSGSIRACPLVIIHVAFISLLIWFWCCVIVLHSAAKINRLNRS